jgi:tRNA threonylcarbamoyladenosine biosynthesis protein TsaE
LNNSTQTYHLLWTHEQQTLDFAQKLSTEPGILDATIALSGDLGTGKTSFTRYLLRALGVVGTIKSPTYAIVESYETLYKDHELHIWHMDFYRFNDPHEWEDAGFRDIFACKGLKIYEWPERVAALVPKPDIEIHLELNALDQREVVLKLNTHKVSNCWTA